MAKHKIQMRYTGRSILTNNKLAHNYQIVSSPNKPEWTGQDMMFTTKLGGWGVGCIIECSREGDSVRGPYRLVKLEHTEQAMQERSEDRAVYDKWQFEKQGRKGVEDRQLEKAIEVIKKRISHASPQAKKMLRYRIMDEILKS